MRELMDKHYDLVIVGGGPAGVASAVTAARRGLKTVLVEKYGFCGGAAVAGLSGTICGMFHGTEDPQAEPVQLVRGFTQEFRAELERLHGITPPQRYGNTWTATFDPYKWREAADNLLDEAGVTRLYHSMVTSVITDGEQVKGVNIHHSGNDYQLFGKRLIDASGDASVVHMIGGGTYCGDRGNIQNPTYMFNIADVDLDKFLKFYGDDTICPDKMTQQMKDLNSSGEMKLPRNKIWIFPTVNSGELLVNATRLAGQDNRMLNVLIPEDFSEAEILGRRQMREYAAYLKKYIPGCENSWVSSTGVQIGIRQTRSIVGVKQLTNSDVTGCRKRSDGIARSAWPIELHSGDKPKLHWIINDWYEIPLGTLIPEQGENIMVAGRNLSAEHEALASSRVTAQCFEYGKAAAITCSLSLENDRPIRDISGEEVRKLMIESGSSFGSWEETLAENN